MASKLNPKQERFCQEYIIDLNATQAAIRSGYSPKSADANATRMMGNDGIAARVKELLGKQAKRTELTADFVLGAIRKIAEDIDAKNFEKLKALELLGRHLRIFADVVQVDGLEKLTDEELKEIIKK